MDIVINLQGVVDVLNLPPDVLALRFFLYVGWIPIVVLLLWMAFYLWMDYIQGAFGSKREFILLAIDVPAANEQSVRAVDYMFSHLAGAHGTINLIDQYWQGKTQDHFSFEIVSIEGYTQFLIWGERKYRSFLEQIVYAQYPDAEITEVDDYINEWPERLPDENYDLWGSEFVLVKNTYLPIRTYPEFEDKLVGEFKDPLAATMELFGSLRKGEQCALQIIITPIGPEWEKGAPAVISDVIGEKKKSTPHGIDRAVAGLMSLLGGLADFFIPTDAEDNKKKEDDGKVSMQDLKPEQKKQMESIQQKISKVGFEVKIRWIYLAHHEVLDKTRANSFVGTIRQFGMQDTNSLKPDTNYTMTSASYVRTASRLLRRKNNILSAFRGRSNSEGRNPMILNTEELATLWHFPVEPSVRAPMLQKVPSRKASAPSYLPIEAASGGGESFDWRSPIEDRPPGAASGEPAPRPAAAAQTDDEARDIFGPEPGSDAAEKNEVTNKPSVGAPTGAPPANLPIG